MCRFAETKATSTFSADYVHSASTDKLAGSCAHSDLCRNPIFLMRTWHSMDIFIHILGLAKQDLNSTWLSAYGRAVPEDKTIWRVANHFSTFSKSSNLSFWCYRVLEIMQTLIDSFCSHFPFHPQIFSTIFNIFNSTCRHMLPLIL